MDCFPQSWAALMCHQGMGVPRGPDTPQIRMGVWLNGD